MFSKHITLFSLILFACVATAAFFLMPIADAFAVSATSVGTQSKQVADQIVIVPKFLAVMCYIIGVFFAVRSLFALKNFIIKADDNPINHFLALGMISALLIALPYIIDVTVNTLQIKTANITSSSGSFSDTGE